MHVVRPGRQCSGQCRTRAAAPVGQRLQDQHVERAGRAGRRRRPGAVVSWRRQYTVSPYEIHSEVGHETRDATDCNLRRPGRTMPRLLQWTDQQRVRPRLVWKASAVQEVADAIALKALIVGLASNRALASRSRQPSASRLNRYSRVPRRDHGKENFRCSDLVGRSHRGQSAGSRASLLQREQPSASQGNGKLRCDRRGGTIQGTRAGRPCAEWACTRPTWRCKPAGRSPLPTCKCRRWPAVATSFSTRMA